eukprot:CAMPEP_0178375172 /NCGR_PEP_ID=MMETSP0689_2-20121128/2750_1 /TAXON_ID=160604 /ORGANISM="Amphidinium massartii, Strain CS-259" /LENGTH=594 /DNA_ID=CAMNT_0019995155 /DNA_START=88 /DNA_END=1869 /DNA_ORIENTATION=+
MTWSFASEIHFGSAEQSRDKRRCSVADFHAFAKDPSTCPILTRTLGTNVFNISTFLLQAIIHLTAPISTLFMKLSGYGGLAENMRLWICPRPSEGLAGLQDFDNLFWMTLVVLPWLFPDAFEDDDIGTWEVTLYPSMVLIMQRFMIALKYAMLTTQEYQAFSNAPPALAHKWMENLQLISGWQRPPEEVMDAEISLSSMMAGTDIGACNFIHDLRDGSSCECWDVWRGVIYDDVQNDKGKSLAPIPPDQIDSCITCPALHTGTPHSTRAVKVIPASDVLRKCIKVARDGAFVVPLAVDILAGLLAAVIPIALRASDKGKWDCDPEAWKECFGQSASAAFGRHPVVRYCVIMSAILTWKYGTICMAFLAVGITHYSRVHFLLKLLCEMARPVADNSPNMPQLQLEGAYAEENVMSLVLCFEVALRFGVRYRQRLRAYTGLIFIGAFGCLLWVYVEVGQRAHQLRHEHLDMASSSATSAFADLRGQSLVMLYGATVCSLIIIVFIFNGAAANEYFPRVRRHLNSRRWRHLLEDKIDNNEGSDDGGKATEAMSESEGYATAFNLALQKLEVLQSNEFIEVGGVKASGELASGLLSTV